MRDSHFVGAHTPLALRPLFEGDMWTLSAGTQYLVADAAGLDNLRALLIDRTWAKGEPADPEEMHPSLRVELARIEGLAGR